MTGLRELYQEVIIDHSKRPRNYGALTDANHEKEGFNPLCGDRLTVYVREENKTLTEIHFVGCGCAISVASASLMTEVLRGKTTTEAIAIFTAFHTLVTQGQDPEAENTLGKLAVLAGVAEYPARVKCATLAWHTLKAALDDANGTVSTE